MNGLKNGFTKRDEGIFVLDSKTPDDVARAMIVDGQQKEAFHLMDLDGVYQRIKHFKAILPRVKICYAMKANDYDNLLKLCVSQGVGFDCASPGEIYKARQMDVNPWSIIYAMPTKTPEQMMYARSAGVKHTTFDSSYELKKMKQYWPNASLLLRIRVDGDSLYKLGDKFGCDYETEAVDLLEEAGALGLNVVGVAFHVGSICSSIDSHAIGLRRAKALFEHEARAGRGMKIVDIGGGFLSEKVESIDPAAKLINAALEEYFPDHSVQVIAEPGRYLCEASATLYSNICNVRRAKKGNKPVNMVYMMDGVHGSLRYPEHWHTVQKFKHTDKTFIENESAEQEVMLWGPTCDSMDQIMSDRTVHMPQLSPLDWLIFKLQGSYTFNFAGPFSCLPLPKKRCVVSLDLWHKIKDSPLFAPSDFVLNPDISSPLQSSLPPKALERPHLHEQTPTLLL